MENTEASLATRVESLEQEVKRMREWLGEWIPIIGGGLITISALIGAIVSCMLYFGQVKQLEKKLDEVDKTVNKLSTTVADLKTTVAIMDTQLHDSQHITANAVAQLAGELKLHDPERYRRILTLPIHAVRTAKGTTVGIASPFFEDAIAGLRFDDNRRVAFVEPRGDTPVLATVSGTVRDVQFTGEGNTAKVTLAESLPAKGLREVLTAISGITDIRVKEGDPVEIGDTLGTSAKTVNFQALIDGKPAVFLETAEPAQKAKAPK